MENIDKFINDNQITEELTYDDVIKKLQEAKEAGTPIDEGILGAISGAILGASFGPKLGNAICSALGIDPKGTLGSLMTSRLVLGAICGKIGMKL